MLFNTKACELCRCWCSVMIYVRSCINKRIHFVALSLFISYVPHKYR